MKNPGIYIITNKINGKQYVGKDFYLPNRPNTHLRGAEPKCKAIHGAIQKYGRENFDVEIIKYPGISHEALYAVEQWHIRKNNSKSPNGYNLTDGGPGAFGADRSIETREKMSVAGLSPVWVYAKDIVEIYVHQNETISKIAKTFEVSNSVIYNILTYYGIKIRYASYYRKGKTLPYNHRMNMSKPKKKKRRINPNQPTLF